MRVLWWGGPSPRPGDALRTARGRLYGVLEYKPAREGKTGSVRCVVLPTNAQIAGRVFGWRWSSRR